MAVGKAEKLRKLLEQDRKTVVDQAHRSFLKAEDAHTALAQREVDRQTREQVR
jgi:hypothetical protein